MEDTPWGTLRMNESTARTCQLAGGKSVRMGRAMVKEKGIGIETNKRTATNGEISVASPAARDREHCRGPRYPSSRFETRFATRFTARYMRGYKFPIAGR